MLLLNDLDKHDLMEGLIGIVELDAAIAVWHHNGMPDYVGTKEKSPPTKKPGFLGVNLCPPFVPWNDEIMEHKDALQTRVFRLARRNYVPFASKNVDTRGSTVVRKKNVRRKGNTRWP